MQTQYMVRGALIATLYVVLTYILAPLSYGPIQFRLSEALTVLPIIYTEAVPGLFVGTMIANILGGLGPWDIFGGSFVTLVAAYLTFRTKHSLWAYVWPIVLNAVFVSWYLSVLYNMPYWLTVLSIGCSEAAVVLIIGYPLLRLFRRYMKVL